MSKKKGDTEKYTFLDDFNLEDLDVTVLGVSLVIYTLHPCWLYNTGCLISVLYTEASLDIQFRMFN